jgi:hypothetical protein
MRQLLVLSIIIPLLASHEASAAEIIAAGAVDINGNSTRYAGRAFRVERPERSGMYIIKFIGSLPRRPIIVAMSDGGQRGAFAEVKAVECDGFVVEGESTRVMA